MVKLENIPSHNKVGKYALLIEKNSKMNESCLFFLKMEKNEKYLYQLSSQINEIDWFDVEDCNTNLFNYINIFSLDMDNLVSALTAYEMSQINVLNMKIRKFDGLLRKIDFSTQQFKDINLI